CRARDAAIVAGRDSPVDLREHVGARRGVAPARRRPTRAAGECDHASDHPGAADPRADHEGDDEAHDERRTMNGQKSRGRLECSPAANAALRALPITAGGAPVAACGRPAKERTRCKTTATATSVRRADKPSTP